MYIILEIQAGEGNPSCLTYVYSDMAEAESRFFTMCAAAVISEVPTHTIIFMTTDGSVIEQRSFAH